MAYEWIFSGVNSYYMAMWQLQDIAARMGDGGAEVDTDAANNPTPVAEAMHMTAEEIAVSKVLKDAFPAYVNSLNLEDEAGNPLTLDENGEGSFRDYIMGKYMESAQDAMSRGLDISSAT